MSRILSGIICGTVGVLVLDTVGSVASRTFHFDYGSLALVSMFIYLAVGAYVVREAPVSRAVAAGGAVGFVDATLGWAISWIIGPGRPSHALDGAGIAFTVTFIALFAAGVAAIGGWLGRYGFRRVTLA